MWIILKGILGTEAVQQILTGAVTALSTWLIALINKRKTIKRIKTDHELAMYERDAIIESLQKQLDKNKNGSIA